MDNFLVLSSKPTGKFHPSDVSSYADYFRGDTIQVTVHNAITAPEEGTALHWHGILQKTSQ